MMKNNLKKEILDAMWKDPGNWRGNFYFNRRDYRIIVPKRDPKWGWTLNFASPYAYIFIIVLILILIAAKFFI